MRGGALKDKVLIGQQTETGRDSLNAPVYSWSTFAEPFCEVVFRRGSELFDEKTGQRYAETYVRLRFRFSEVEGVTETMRITFEGKLYDIRNILPDYTRRQDTYIEVSRQDGQ